MPTHFQTGTPNGCTRTLPIGPALRLLFVQWPWANAAQPKQAEALPTADLNPAPVLSALVGSGAGPREDSDTQGRRTEAGASSRFKPRLGC